MSDSDNSQNSEESTESLSTGDVTMDPTEQPNIHSQEGLIEENFDPVNLLEEMDFGSGYRLFQTLIDIIIIAVSVFLFECYLRDSKFLDKINSHPIMQEEEIDERTSRLFLRLYVYSTVVLSGVILVYRLGESINLDWRNFNPVMLLQQMDFRSGYRLFQTLIDVNINAVLIFLFVWYLRDPKFLDKINSHPVMQEEEIDERTSRLLLSLIVYATVVLSGVILIYRLKDSINLDWRNFHPAMALEEFSLWTLIAVSTIAAPGACFIRLLTDPKFLDEPNFLPGMEAKGFDPWTLRLLLHLFTIATVAVPSAILLRRLRDRNIQHETTATETVETAIPEPQQIPDHDERTSNVSEPPTEIEGITDHCRRTYICRHCRAHLANHNELISKSFQGIQGEAYLFDSVSENVYQGPAEERVLLTGLHAVADIYCECCKTKLGWKYEHAFVNKERYKEGKFVIEQAHMIKENGWE